MALTIQQWLSDQGFIPSNRHHLADVDHFGFGEAGYYIKMIHGQTHFDGDFDRLLDVLLTEADAADWGISMTFADGLQPVGNKIAKRKNLDLIVHVNKPMNGKGEYNAKQVAIIRQMVTLFNLTGSWDTYQRANL